MEAADHGRIERNGGKTRLDERCAAVDGRKARAAPRGGRCVTEQHHADDDHLHAPVIADLRDGGLDILNGARLTKKIQNGERAEDHQHDFEAFLDALPDQRIEHLDSFGKPCAVEVKVGEGEQQRP